MQDLLQGNKLSKMGGGVGFIFHLICLYSIPDQILIPAICISYTATLSQWNKGNCLQNQKQNVQIKGSDEGLWYSGRKHVLCIEGSWFKKGKRRTLWDVTPEYRATLLWLVCKIPKILSLACWYSCYWHPTYSESKHHYFLCIKVWN